jgi:hypothetical protein
MAVRAWLDAGRRNWRAVKWYAPERLSPQQYGIVSYRDRQTSRCRPVPKNAIAVRLEYAVDQALGREIFRDTTFFLLAGKVTEAAETLNVVATESGVHLRNGTIVLRH